LKSRIDRVGQGGQGGLDDRVGQGGQGGQGGFGMKNSVFLAKVITVTHLSLAVVDALRKFEDKKTQFLYKMKKSCQGSRFWV
jgi:hypothetical protein